MGNKAIIHLILHTGREYTFNYDEPYACARSLQINRPNDLQKG